MILYSPINGDVLTEKFNYSPKTCFLMTQLGGKVSNEILEIRKKLVYLLSNFNINLVDANSKKSGKDFLDKIWKQILGIPIGVAILTPEMRQTTVANIYYELAMFDSLGKETIVVKSLDFKIPSDSIRTEYIEFSDNFDSEFNKFITNIFDRANHYEDMAEIMKADPILSFDYLRRAFLITNNLNLKEKAKEVFENNESSFKDHDRKFAKGFLISRNK